jgi:tetratricopeptide (TPR) repeat protein
MWLAKLLHGLTHSSSDLGRLDQVTAEQDSLGKLFISYAREDDEPFVERLYRDLTASGFGVWWDREAMESRSRTFLQEIRDAMEDADRVIAVIGPRAVASKYVRYEWDYAEVFCKGVVPVLRKGGYDLVPPELSGLHCPDFRNERHYRKTLAELVRILGVPVPPLGSLRSTPHLPAHFLVRRNEIARVVKTITSDIRTPIVVTSAEQTAALEGMAGVGKSVLAAAVARASETRRAFEHGVVWLRLGQIPDLLQKIRELGLALGDEERHYKYLETARGNLQQLLQNKVCLIVLDDVWEVAQVEPFQGALGPRCRLLITSRDGTIATALGAQEHRLDVLSDEEAYALLGAWTEERFDVAAAHDIASEVGNLPFALALCGAMIRDGVSWTDLAATLREADMAFLDRQFPDYPYRDVFKSLHVSVDFLSRSHPTAAELYRDLAVFPVELGVPEAAILKLWVDHSNVSERDARSVLVTLQRKALLRLEGNEPSRRVILHSLQFDYLRKVSGDLTLLHARVLEAYRKSGTDGWASVPDDGYFYDHAASHFIGAGRTDELYALVEDRTWYEAKRDLDPTLYSYVEDVKAALQWAGRSEAVDMPRLVAYTWLLSSVTAAVKELPVDALEAMVVLGKSDQALRHLEMVGDVHRYVWASRRLVGLLVARGNMAKAKEVAERAVSRALATDEELGSELHRKLPPLAELLAELRVRNQQQAPTKLRDLLERYDAVPDAILEPDREFILLGPIEYDIGLHALAFVVGGLTTWMITRVDFPESASPKPTAGEEGMFRMLPLLSLTLGTERVDTDLVRGTVAEILAETGEAESALAMAAGLQRPLIRLDVMSLALRAFAERENAEAVDMLWSDLADISTEKYAGATPDRVRILMRVADACMHSKIAEAAMKKAHSLCTIPGLAEAVASGRAVDETLNRELAMRKGREQLAEELFGGSGGYAIIEAQCLLAEKVVHDTSAFGDAGAALRKSADALLERAIGQLEKKMKDADRVKAFCAVARALQVFGRETESATMLQRAESLAEQLDQGSRGPAMADIASTLVHLGDMRRAEELLRRALEPSKELLDKRFRIQFLSAWVKALIDAGDVDRALAIARGIDDESARLTIMSEAVGSLGRSGLEAQGLQVADEINAGLTDMQDTAESAILTNVAIGLALSDRSTDAKALLERAIAKAQADETDSARLETLIKIVSSVADIGGSLAFEVCEKIDNPDIRAVLFATLLQVAARQAAPETDLANLFMWALTTGAQVGKQTYYLPIALLMAVRALQGSERKAGITSRIQEQYREMALQAIHDNPNSSVVDPKDEPPITAELLTERALSSLAGLGQRDHEIGTLRAANALRIAAGVERIPLDIFKGGSLDQIWEMVESEPVKDREDQASTDRLRQGLRELGQRGGMNWLESHLDGCVGVLVEDGLVDATWQRMETVMKLFSES